MSSLPSPAGPSEIPESPPHAVIEQINAAARAWEQLKASRREVRFGTDPATGRLSVALWDTDGHFLKSLSPRQVLELSTGGPLD